MEPIKPLADIPMGLCQCGCGQTTRRSDTTSSKRGYRAGDPRRYVLGHSARSVPKGVYLYSLDKAQHIVIAERALGKPLPKGAEVHHVDGNKSNNKRGNLVVCEGRAYHSLLHQRQRALDACGNPSFRKCQHCKRYDDVANLSAPSDYRYHRQCKNEYLRGRRRSDVFSIAHDRLAAEDLAAVRSRLGIG